MKDVIAAAIFILIVAFLLSSQVIYAISKGQPDCMFAQDVITCVKIGDNK